MFYYSGKRLYKSFLSGRAEAASAGKDAEANGVWNLHMLPVARERSGTRGARTLAASDYLIAANDEHGVNPPTPGKRTPELPYLGRSFYENEFNRGAKNFFIAACRRQGFRTFDVKPELWDIGINQRVMRINRSGASLAVTFAFNAYGDGASFNGINGIEVIYSDANAYAPRSRRLSELVYAELIKETPQRGRGVRPINSIGVLRNVNMPSTLAECGFMTNNLEAKYMLDPDYQQECGEACCEGVCRYLDIDYIGYTPNRSAGRRLPAARAVTTFITFKAS